MANLPLNSILPGSVLQGSPYVITTNNTNSVSIAQAWNSQPEPTKYVSDRFTSEEWKKLYLLKDDYRFLEEGILKQCSYKLGLNIYNGDFVISGGASASLLQGEMPKDIDIFCFRNCESHIAIVENYKINFNKWVNDHTLGAMISTTARPVQFESKIGLHYANDRVVGIFNIYLGAHEPLFHIHRRKNQLAPLTVRIQIIFSDYGSPKKLIEHFDFAHCTPYYDLTTSVIDKMRITRKAFDSIMNKKLVMNNTNHKNLFWRKKKFLSRGWKE